MTNILIQAWVVHKAGDQYYLPYTNWVYLSEIVKYYDDVCLLSPVKQDDTAEETGLLPVGRFSNVRVIPLPYAEGYMNQVRHLFSYNRAYKKHAAGFDSVYVRYPSPCGWLSKRYFRNKRRIVHFVGDPIDAARNNPNFSLLKKTMLISFFQPEHQAYLWACKGAKVFTNGTHLQQRLAAQRVNATAVVSSTLDENDFFLDEQRQLSQQPLKLLYVGYLRKAKGVEVVIRAFHELLQTKPDATLTIVGSGDFENDLKTQAAQAGISNKINFVGHVDKRNQLNRLLRTHDVFVFASLSEGSPRVILEAMANGINVISTPVGSLPGMFKNEEDILFADFNDHTDFKNKIISLTTDDARAASLRKNAFNKVKEVTIQQFIRKIFYES
ncbi:glycosyltransferase family 4 protein [Chitinophaga solisilvae]|uniref:glycosyltransferase family 4 protein n=1 Tax=Chitinophaga solisilvae TaxID=1233460 RepID=UPI00136FD4AD|nr:glycosyltransferase family 4 protein [Chitinophaga solisilvae]